MTAFLALSNPSLGLSVFLLGGIATDGALLAVLFLPKIRVGLIRAGPERTLPYLAHRIRLSQFPVSEVADGMTTRIGRVSAARILVHSTGEGSEVAVQARPSPGGWGAIGTLMILGWTAFAAIPLIFHVFSRVSNFAGERIAPLLREGVPEAFRPDDVTVMLMGSLTESHRHAQEAFEAERDRYWDSQGLVVLGALFAGFLLFLGFSLVSSEPDFNRRMTDALLQATASVLALALPSAWVIRRRVRPRLQALRDWTERIRAAMAREAMREAPAEGTGSTFELLLAAGRELPRWVEVTRRAGLTRDPASWFLLFIMTLVAAQLLVFAGGSIVYPGVGFALVLGLAGIGLAVGAYWYYRRWKRIQEERLTRQGAEWNRKFESLRSRMDRFLQGL